jgi:DNA-directed RNA polymerase subunit RPC12/RpoP
MTTILAFLLSSFIVLLSKLAQGSVELSQEECEELSERVCPACGSRHLIKNGSVHNGKPNINVKVVVVNLLSILLKQLFHRK